MLPKACFFYFYETVLTAAAEISSSLSLGKPSSRSEASKVN